MQAFAAAIPGPNKTVPTKENNRMKWVDTERAALADAFSQASPDDPTLCAGWTTSHLLAHLVQRENNLFGNIADQIGRRPPGQEKHLGKLVATTQTRSGYDALIRRLADGPPSWSPMSWAGEQLNLLEFLIHHEDVRRGSGAGTPPPRQLPNEEQQAIFQRLPMLAKLSYRRALVGIILATPDKDRKVAKNGNTKVELLGTPIDLALYLSGRQRVANVDLQGPADAKEAFLHSQKTT
jgi:uncharacterized protein (TIGR03085 family)